MFLAFRIRFQAAQSGHKENTDSRRYLRVWAVVRGGKELFLLFLRFQVGFSSLNWPTSEENDKL